MPNIARNLMLLCLLATLSKSLSADPVPGKPVTTGRQVLIVYNGTPPACAPACNPISNQIVNGPNGLVNILSAGGTGFNFNVELLDVPQNYNSTASYASGDSYAVDNAAMDLLASNYCLIIDVRFRDQNRWVTPAAPEDQVAGDTIVQADTDAYSAYLASGGGLFVLGDNYWDTTLNRHDGFSSRMSHMHQFINNVAAIPLGAGKQSFEVVSDPGGWYPGGSIDYYGILSDYNNLPVMSPSVFLSYPGFINIANIGSGKPWTWADWGSQKALGLAWQGGDLQGAYSAGRLAYHGDASAFHAMALGTYNEARWQFENIVDFLFRDTCSTTPTPTPTVSLTLTATPTLQTPTSTYTLTPTPTFTLTATPTRTVTFTPTYTPTFTATPTYTPTFTITFTPTFTLTATPTSTVTFTPTYTATYTITTTPTPTYTLTATRTATSTLTVTASATPTFTPTVTRTITSPHSPTATPTHTPTFTFTLTFTSTFTRTSTRTVTPTRTVTSTFTQTLTATASSTLTATPTMTPTFTHSPTVTETPVPLPYKIVIRAYNSAGELVKILYDGFGQIEPGDISTSIDTLASGNGDAVGINFPGLVNLPAGPGGSLSWDGANDSGQYISSGQYWIKAEIVDQFGTITSLITSLQVLNVEPQNWIYIFNSAGEIVRKAALTAGIGNPKVIQIGLASNAISPVFDPATGSVDPATVLGIYFQRQDASSGMFYWDGLNQWGQPVQSGSYTVQLISRDSGQETQVQSAAVMVMRNDTRLALADAFFGPNPAGMFSNSPGVQTWVFYTPSPAGKAHLNLYNLAGELVTSAGETVASRGKIPVHIGNLSSGVYVAVFEVRNGPALLLRKTMKLAIVN